jgi:hypothetical protein
VHDPNAAATAHPVQILVTVRQVYMPLSGTVKVSLATNQQTTTQDTKEDNQRTHSTSQQRKHFVAPSAAQVHTYNPKQRIPLYAYESCNGVPSVLAPHAAA